MPGSVQRGVAAGTAHGRAGRPCVARGRTGGHEAAPGSQDLPAARAPGVEEAKVRDTLIRGEILKAYFEYDAIEADRVEISVAEGVVHLGGEVPDRSALERAERMAGSAKNVVSVINELPVTAEEGGY
ncbi:MAG: BON domain-containing protein [Gammaproteobacteria bacterium]